MSAAAGFTANHQDGHEIGRSDSSHSSTRQPERVVTLLDAAENIVGLTPHDVLVGPNMGAFPNAGNKFFRRLIRLRQEKFRLEKGKPKEREQIIDFIHNTIRGLTPPGNFKCLWQGEWANLAERQAKTIIAECLGKGVSGILGWDRPIQDVNICGKSQNLTPPLQAQNHTPILRISDRTPIYQHGQPEARSTGMKRSIDMVAKVPADTADFSRVRYLGSDPIYATKSSNLQTFNGTGARVLPENDSSPSDKKKKSKKKKKHKKQKYEKQIDDESLSNDNGSDVRSPKSDLNSTEQRPSFLFLHNSERLAALRERLSTFDYGALGLSGGKRQSSASNGLSMNPSAGLDASNLGISPGLSSVCLESSLLREGGTLPSSSALLAGCISSFQLPRYSRVSPSIPARHLLGAPPMVEGLFGSTSHQQHLGSAALASASLPALYTYGSAIPTSSIIGNSQRGDEQHAGTYSGSDNRY